MKFYIIFIIVTSTTGHGCIIDDYELEGPESKPYYPNGYTSHYEMSTKIESQLLNSINNAVKSVWKKSTISTDSLMRSLSSADYTFLLLIETLSKNDIAFSYILLNELNKLSSGSISTDIFENKVIFSFNDIYNSIKLMSTINAPISKFVIESVKYVVNRYSLVTEASLRNDQKLLEWLIKNGYDLKKDGPLSVEKAWAKSFVNVTELLLMNNALVSIPENSKVVFTQNREKQTVLHLAVKIKHFNSVLSLLEAGANINNRDINGNIPIHTAVRTNDSAMFDLLVENGADIWIQTKSKNTLLHLAVEVGNMKMTRYLISKGISVNNENMKGKTPLYIASSRNFRSVMRELEQAGANASHRNHLGNTLLHIAAAENDVTCIKNLLSYGVDVNAYNKKNVPPLYSAVINDNVEAIEILWKNWANINFKAEGGDSLLHVAASANKLKSIIQLMNIGCDCNFIEIKNDYGGTPFYSAALKGNIEAMKLLQRYGAKMYVNVPGNWTLLHLAARMNEELAVNSLLASGFFVNKKAKWDYTALHLAVHYSEAPLIKLLINYGADVNARDHHDKTPIYEATWYGRLDVVEILYNNKADIRIVDNEGASPLHVAAKWGFVKLVDFFIDKGMDINSKRKDGKTPLHEAVYWGKDEIVQHLLSKKANPNLKNSNNEQPLHVAAALGHENIVKMLIEAGANINATINENQTPLYFASVNSRKEVVNYLLQKGSYNKVKCKHSPTCMLAIMPLPQS